MDIIISHIFSISPSSMCPNHVIVGLLFPISIIIMKIKNFLKKYSFGHNNESTFLFNFDAGLSNSEANLPRASHPLKDSLQ